MFGKYLDAPLGRLFKSYLLIILVHTSFYNPSLGQIQNSTYPKVQNFPHNNISYPSLVHSRSSENAALPAGQGTNLIINGESYNLRTSDHSNNKETHIFRTDMASPRDSYSPNGPGSGENAGSNSDNSSSTLPTPEPTDTPVIGAIDYVLLPLLFLGVAGPIFVVMYIVMGSIEFKLSPNVQQRSLLDKHKNSYIDMTSIYQTARPTLNILYDTVSRAIDYGECKEKIACQVGSYAQEFRGYFLYDYFERFLKGVTPRKFSKPLKAYMASVRNGNETCSKFACIY